VHILLSRLQGVRPAGDGRWSALCSAHPDRTSSLSIRDTGERILIHCFAGCAADDVLAAVNLKWSDFYPDKWACARLRPNEGARRWARRALAAADPLDLEREVLRIAAAQIRSGRDLSIEDAARVELAKLRLESARGAQ
jgi:hypothetical protein